MKNQRKRKFLKRNVHVPVNLHQRPNESNNKFLQLKALFSHILFVIFVFVCVFDIKISKTTFYSTNKVDEF